MCGALVVDAWQRQCTPLHLQGLPHAPTLPACTHSWLLGLTLTAVPLVSRAASMMQTTLLMKGQSQMISRSSQTSSQMKHPACQASKGRAGLLAPWIGLLLQPAHTAGTLPMWTPDWRPPHVLHPTNSSSSNSKSWPDLQIPLGTRAPQVLHI